MIAISDTAVKSIEGVAMLAGIAFVGLLHHYASMANFERAIGQWLCRDARRREERAVQRSEELRAAMVAEFQATMSIAQMPTTRLAMCCKEPTLELHREAR